VGFEPTDGLHHLRFSRPSHRTAKDGSGKELRQSPPEVAHHLPTDTCQSEPPRPTPTDPDLAAVVAAWPELPEAIKAGIVAMVKATRS